MQTVVPFALALAAASFAQDRQLQHLAEVGEASRASAALGDVDGDGIADLVIGKNGPFAVRAGLAGAPQRRFADERLLDIAVECSCENTGQPQLVDFDGDGDLDLVALDTPMRGSERVVWFANDGRGRFAAAVELRAAGGRELRWQGQASAVAVADADGDGRLDLCVATPRVLCFAGSASGFAAEPRERGVTTEGAMALADWDADGAHDLLTVEDGRVVVRSKGGRPVRLAEVAGDSGQARLGVADWNGDGRLDLLLGETLPAAPAAAAGLGADDEQRLAAARQVLQVIGAERERIDRSRPPLDDAAAMARRQLRRAELERWAAGPQAVIDELQRQPAGAGLQARVRLVLGS